MTVQNPPIFIQAGSHPAEDVRRWMDAMVESNPGVVAAADMAVTEKSGTANMSVDVAGGRAFIAGDEATYQGTYAVENRGVANVVVSASDPTNPRRDLIVARIKDAAYSGAVNTFSIEVVTGTPAASPVDPTVPANCLTLARVEVAALASSITDANITDLRTRAYALGVAANNDHLENLPLKIAHGRTSVVFDGSGSGTLNYGTTFGAGPTVVCQMAVATSTQRTVTLSATPGTTSANLFSTSNDASAGGTYTIDWIAVGIPA